MPEGRRWLQGGRRLSDEITKTAEADLTDETLKTPAAPCQGFPYKRLALSHKPL
jgi:hypothetical protein